MLVPEVMLVVHPIDVDRHPTVPAGWRWAVHVGGGSPSDTACVANAGWAPDERLATAEGEQNAATAAEACRMFGVPVDYRLLRLDSDPIPTGTDRVRIMQ